MFDNTIPREMDRHESAKRTFLSALSLQEQGRFREAERLYREALSLAPDRPSIMNNLAVVCLNTGKFQEARRLCERLLELDPHDAEARVHLGVCQVKLGSPAAALATFERLLEIRPDDVHALANRGTALLALNRPEEALASCGRALSIRPGFPEALNVRGNALVKLERPEEALASFRGALDVAPGHRDSVRNLAATLLRLGRNEEVNAIHRQAIASQPDATQRYVEYGDALLMQQRWDEASAQFESALKQDPDCAGAHYGLACARLFEGDFARGWPGYERRIETEDYRLHSFRDNADSLALYEGLPRWRGPGEPGVMSVGIWAEQGIGDQVLFSTLIPELDAAGVSYVYELDARLLAAYRRAFPGTRFVARQDPPHESLRDAARVLAAGSLPGLYRRARVDFARQPPRLLGSRPGRAAHYRSRLAGHGAGRIVAIAWRTVRDHWWALKKSARLLDLAPLLQVAGVRFVDVQYGDTDAERAALEAAHGVRLHRFGDVDHYHDIEELLAILDACDLVITTSNATAHFAGALGKPTWLIYPGDRPPFHYWAHRGDRRCLWYPSVRIVTAPELTDWPSLAAHAGALLRAELA